MRIRDYIKPGDLSHAYERLVGTKGAVVMGGGIFLRLQNRTVPLMIDLADLGLDGVNITGDRVEIGAMTTLRQIEKHIGLPEALTGAMKQIAGISVRNMATIGGSVMGRYPFSDVIPVLLSFDTTLHFHSSGDMALLEYLENGLPCCDILTHLTFRMPEKSAYKAYKTIYTDFALVNVSVAKKDGYCVSIGARPGHSKCVRVDGAEEVLGLVERFEFGTDHRASAEYRKALAQALLEDIWEGGESWK
jgi:CO/xanthine dehydrogenase FAD-binding subunit